MSKLTKEQADTLYLWAQAVKANVGGKQEFLCSLSRSPNVTYEIDKAINELSKVKEALDSFMKVVDTDNW